MFGSAEIESAFAVSKEVDSLLRIAGCGRTMRLSLLWALSTTTQECKFDLHERDMQWERLYLVGSQLISPNWLGDRGFAAIQEVNESRRQAEPPRRKSILTVACVGHYNASVLLVLGRFGRIVQMQLGIGSGW